MCRWGNACILSGLRIAGLGRKPIIVIYATYVILEEMQKCFFHDAFNCMCGVDQGGGSGMCLNLEKLCLCLIHERGQKKTSSSHIPY